MELQPELFDSALAKALGAVLAAVILETLRLVWGRARVWGVKARLNRDPHTSKELKDLVAVGGPYVAPDCQDNDPAFQEEPENRKSLFDTVDELLGPPLQGRLTLLLADSGMGKTRFLQEYYRQHWCRSKKRKRFKMVLVDLGQFDVNENITRITSEDCSMTVLLLDALDEDRSAKGIFEVRFRELERIAGRFHSVLISCRTQFLAGESAIPELAELPPPVGAMGLDDGPDRKVRRVFLSLFSQRQMRRYVAQHLPLWRHPILRYRALQTMKRFSDLVARPFLLSHIQDLVGGKEELKNEHQVYSKIVEKWLDREERKGTITTRRDDLLDFSAAFAGRLFEQDRDGLTILGLDDMIGTYHVCLNDREVRERSLLNCDATGQWKFAHRSVMEYFLVVQLSALETPPSWASQTWTDLMRRFVLQMVRSGHTNLPGADLTGVDLKGIDLSRANLVEVRLSGAQLSQASFRKADLTGADLRQADLSGADLSDASGSRTNLAETILWRAHLENADLSRADLEDAKLDSANLRDAQLFEVNFRRASLKRATLSGAMLRGAHLERAQLQGSALENADLSGACLDLANFEAASLDGANLQGASLDGTVLTRASLENANFEGADLDGTHMESAVLRRVNLAGAGLHRGHLGGADLTGAILNRANLAQVSMENAVLLGAQLNGASILDADLDSANLEGASLKWASLQHSNLRNACFKGADLYGASLDQANLCWANLEGARMTKARIDGADLRSARGLTQEQLDGIGSFDQYTLLPEGMTRPSKVKERKS